MRVRRVAWLLFLAACGGETTAPDLGTADLGVPDVGPLTCTSDVQCDDGLFCNGAARCMPGDAMADGRGCVPMGGNPCLPGQTCSEGTRMCLTMCDTLGDADGDGHSAIDCGGDDCDDSDPNRYAGATETCDSGGRDEDCNPATLGPDLDADGFVSTMCCNRQPGAVTSCGFDCDDTTMDVSPTAPEVCDGVDDNCDGRVDEEVTTTFFHDLDGDGFGDDTMTRTGCSAPSGYVLSAGDCDDTRATVHPGQLETCNMIDDDCDSVADPDCACVDGATQPCGTGDGAGGFLMVGTCRAGLQTCSVGRWGDCADSVSPVPEVCNGADDDCNGSTDDGATTRYFHDSDGDGFGDLTMPLDACTAPANYQLSSNDCDDAAVTTHPGATEICNGVDDNCNGSTDEGVTTLFYRDADGDAHGVIAGGIPGCSAPAGYAASNDDCNDGNASIHPGVTDGCDGIENDCVAPIDPGCTCVNGTTRNCGPMSGSTFLNVGICRMGSQSCTAGTWGACVGAVYPIAELCNGADDDCNGVTDNGVTTTYHGDCDSDSYGGSRTLVACSPPSPPPGGIPLGCSMGAWVANATDCDDTRSISHPMATEICDGLDNDCNASIDGTPATAWCNLAPQRALLPNVATATCTSSACRVATCTAPYLDCTTAAGCETNGAVDHLHCGTCTRTCSFVCNAGACDNVVQLATGIEHACALLASRRVMCWGRNDHGQLADGTLTDRRTPTLVPGITDAVEVTAGDLHTCVRRSSGAVSCWGYNSNAQLGAGLGADRSTPVAVAGLTDAREVSAGASTTCARRAGGTVVCWGANYLGQIGDGTLVQRSAPTAVSFVSDATGIALNGNGGCLRHATGQIHCWGAGSNGQLGDGLASHMSCGGTDCTPTISTSGTVGDASAITRGSAHGCVIRSGSGRAACWGSNMFGQVGNGTTTDVFNPTSLTTFSPTMISAGSQSTCGRLSTGQVQCFGDNSSGQLGDGTLTQRTTAVNVSGLTDGVEVRVGGNFACARRTTGTIVCWGRNNRGQLGDGTTTDRRTPTAVAIP